MTPSVNDAPPAGRADAVAAELATFAAAQAGDFAAFEAIVRAYQDRLFRLAYNLTRSHADAEEVVQETFLSAFRGLGSRRPDAAPGAWLCRIAVNAALMRLRLRRRKPLLSLEDQGAMQGDPQADVPFWSAGAWARQPEAQFASARLSERIAASIEQLPEKYRLVLMLRDMEGHSNEEVALTMGLTVPTVKSRLHRARLHVRQQIEVYFQAL